LLYEEGVAALKGGLGDAAFTAAFDHGQALSLEAAIVYALDASAGSPA
jgi:hypothetical protein